MARPKNPNLPLFRGSAHLKAWQKCYEEWLNTCFEQSGSKHTVAGYKSNTKHFFTDPKKAPERYTREQITEYIRSQVYHRGQGMVEPSARTRNHRLAALKSFYEFAAEYHPDGSLRPLLHTPSPVLGLRAVTPGRTPRGLTEDELKRLFAVIPRNTGKGLRDFALLSAYFWSARRREEILRLKWGDLHEVTFIDGSGMRAGHMYKYSSKGHSRDSFTAEYPVEAWEPLIEYLKATGRYDQMTADTPLFVSSRWRPWSSQQRPYNGCAANHELQAYARAAGIAKPVTLHWLRHTRAQLQRKYDNSPDCLEKIRLLLGHESITTTFIYLQFAEQKPDDGAELLRGKIGKL